MNSIEWPAHMHYKPFASAAELEDELSAQIAATLGEACVQRLRPSLVVSGGRTPAALFEKLSQQDIPWHKIAITLSDERWVAADHAASNEKLVRAKLLKNKASGAEFISLTTDHHTPEAGLQDIEARLADIPQPFNIVLLGMGDDGHTASLFPDAPELNAALQSANMCHPMHPASADQSRVSLTASALLNSREIIVLISGPEKLEVMRSALSGNDVMQMPVRFLFQQQRVPVTFYWSPAQPAVH